MEIQINLTSEGECTSRRKVPRQKITGPSLAFELSRKQLPRVHLSARPLLGPCCLETHHLERLSPESRSRYFFVNTYALSNHSVLIKTGYCLSHSRWNSKAEFVDLNFYSKFFVRNIFKEQYPLNGQKARRADA